MQQEMYQPAQTTTDKYKQEAIQTTRLYHYVLDSRSIKNKLLLKASKEKIVFNANATAWTRPVLSHFFLLATNI